MSKEYRVGYTTGVYDMFHVGHLNLLRRAKERCDYLIVGISTDELVQETKNKTPIISFEDRCEIVRGCKYVDEVVPQFNKDKVAAYHKYKFDVMFVGDDWKGSDLFNKCEAELKKFGVDVVYFPYTKSISSSILRGKVKNSDSLGKKYKIGYTTGVYDMFHIGHLNLLRRAKEQCDYLIVGVSTDECAKTYKHKAPVIPFEERRAIVESIEYVDATVPQETMDKYAAWEKIHFDALFHGDDWKGSSMYDEIERKLRKHGVEFVYFPYTKDVSSTLLKEKIANGNSLTNNIAKTPKKNTTRHFGVLAWLKTLI